MGYTKTNEAVFSNELLDTVIEHSFDGIYICLLYTSDAADE